MKTLLSSLHEAATQHTQQQQQQQQYTSNSTMPQAASLLQLAEHQPSIAFLQLLAPVRQSPVRYIDVDGPVGAEDTLIHYDVPFAPESPARSLRLRQSLHLAVEERVVDANVRIVLDRVIAPRRWRDAQGTLWVQHASPYPASRTEVLQVHDRFLAKLAQHEARRTGTCEVRTLLVAECYLEMIRQVVAECWERGLLLLHVHTERVAAQVSHRELFESRVGHAFRLALKGDKDTAQVEHEMAQLRAKIAALAEEERTLRKLCDEFAAYAEEQTLIEEKQHSDAVAMLKKEGLIKKNQLEQMVAVPHLS